MLTALSGGVPAQERPDIGRMRCAEAAGLVTARGAVILGTGPHLFERIVRDQSFCELETTTAPAYLPARDAPLCFAGYRCRDLERGESRSDR